MKFKKNRRLIGVTMCMILMFSTFLNIKMLHAAEKEESIIYEEMDNVKTFRGDNYLSPTKEGYKFAGWYEKDTTKESEYTPLNAEEANDKTTAFAKFVVEDVLSVRCQYTAGTTLESEKTNLRMLTSVDSLQYSSVGFEIKIDDTTVKRESKKVYTSINGYTKEDGITSYTASEAFGCSVSQYFMAFSITDIAKSYYAKSFTITPFWTTIDGTVVTGIQKMSFTIEGVLTEGIGLVTIDDFVADYGSQGGSFSYDMTTSHTEDGTGSVVLSSDGRLWPAVGVKLGLTQEELEKYESVVFYIKPESLAGSDAARIQIGNSAENYATGEWHKIMIPVSSLTADSNGAVKLFNLLNDANEISVKDNYMKVYIDDMMLK